MSCKAVEEAVLLTCDVPTRQYILHVDVERQREQGAKSFVIRQLDPTHLYVEVSPVEPAWACHAAHTGAVPCAQADCMPLLHRKLEELQALR